MEMERPKPKKKKGRDGTKQKRHAEKVPLHDIVNVERPSSEQELEKPSSAVTSNTDLSDVVVQKDRDPEDDVKPKKTKKRKNIVSPETSVITVAEQVSGETEYSVQGEAWGNESIAVENNGDEEPMLATHSTGSKSMDGGISNPALSMDEDVPELPGSVPNLQDSSIDSMSGLSPPVANSTVVEDDMPTESFPSLDDLQSVTTPKTSHKGSKQQPGTPKSDISTPGTKFHRALFGRPLSGNRVTPVEKNEEAKENRPSTAPGRRLPFVTDFSNAPQKRPATAAVYGQRRAKAEKLEFLDSPSPHKKSRNGSTRSLRTPECASPQQAVAYVPYKHARGALTRVIDDMKKMKSSHLTIVSQIEEQYQGIEMETKNQFNSFIISMQDENSEKINTFRQTIEDHNKEIKERNAYWIETVQSLSKRNKELLRQKRALLLAYRKDTQKLEEERNALQAQLLAQIGEQDSKLKHLESQIEDTRNESQDTEDETNVRKIAIATAIPVGAVVSRKNLVDSVCQTDGAFSFDYASADDGSVWKERYNKEKEEREIESLKLETELKEAQALLSSSKSSSGEEKKVYEDKIIEISKELAKTKLYYDTMYEFLKSLMATVDCEEQFKTSMERIENDRKIMFEEKEHIAPQIKKWQDDWKDAHDGNLPGEEDRPDAIKELDTQLEEIEVVLDGLNKQEAALTLFKQGRFPEPETTAPEPLIQTIKVRDPDLLSSLESQNARIEFLENKLEGAQNDSSRISELQYENTDLRNKLEKLEEESKSMKIAAPLVATSVALSSSHSTNVEEREAVLLLRSVLNEIGVINSQLKKSDVKIDQRLEELEEEEETKMRDPVESVELKDIRLSIAAVKMIKDKELMKDLSGLIPRDDSEERRMLIGELEDCRGKIDDLQSQLDDMDGKRFPASMNFEAEDSDIEDLHRKLQEYQDQIDETERQLGEEKERSENLRSEADRLSSELEEANQKLTDGDNQVDAKIVAATAAMTLSLTEKERRLDEANEKIELLEKEKFSKLDVDARDEIRKAKSETKSAKAVVVTLEKEKGELEVKLAADEQKIHSLTEKNSAQAKQEADLRLRAETARKEKQKAVKECEAKFTERERKRKAEDDAKFKLMEAKILRLEAGESKGKSSAGQKPDAATERKLQRLEAQITEVKKMRAEDQNRIKHLDQELKEAKAAVKSVAGEKEKKLVEKKVKELEKKLETETKKFEREQKRANELAEELEKLKKEFADLEKNYVALKEECAKLNVAADEGAEAALKVDALEKELKQLTAEVRTLTDNYNSERVLRKKYYNMVEDMKGKIRVYCRYRPISGDEKSKGCVPVAKAPDEYTIQIESNRGGVKEFQFDQIFTSDSTQEEVFEDTNNLVQSAVDGYNVCIFAYGQTGSGKTFTMIGDKAQSHPGIAPRAFDRIYELIEENKGKLRFQISCYMLELYNEKLIDLLAAGGPKNDDVARLDVRKDKKGMVYVQGTTVLSASSSKELYTIFEKGSESRHVASTKMNSESSRSHLVVAVVLESTNLTTGAVTRGKLSLVDLAGSERVGKTGATAQQLKEANSINKSLSALGDVISALSSEQSFIPYRNNKLTMLMQDSLGGNAKTLMFVNISPADYNADETIISLTYASRVKLITNDASKNADSREVARLRSIISKLKAGESIEEDE